jgi:hypothetical protein
MGVFEEYDTIPEAPMADLVELGARRRGLTLEVLYSLPVLAHQVLVASP